MQKSLNSNLLLGEITRILHSEEEIMEKITSVLKQFALAVEVSDVILWTVKGQDETIKPFALFGDRIAAIGDRTYEKGEGIPGWCVEMGLPILSNNIARDKHMKRFIEDRYPMRIENILVVPLMVDNIAFGCLQVFNKMDGEFSLEDVTMIYDVVAVLSIYINTIDRINKDRLIQQQKQDLEEITIAKTKIEEALRIQDEIFTNISHELKTPLSLIFTANQLLEMSIKNDSLQDDKEMLKRCATVIRQNCFRFMKLINNIIDFSKIDSGYYKIKLSNENIVGAVEDIVNSVKEHIKCKGQTIHFQSDMKEKIIACDLGGIERIILNLISNAIKFSNPGNEIHVSMKDAGEWVEISVRDFGVGIEKKYLNTIFERFSQVDKTSARNAEGSGIGLSLVKLLVNLHEGKITVESEVDKGSTFRVMLPVRTVETSELIRQFHQMRDKSEMINIEFSDIYG